MHMPFVRTAFSTSFVFIFLSSALLTLTPRAAQAQLPVTEIEASDGTTLMQLFDDSGLVVLGESGAGAIPAEAPAPKPPQAPSASPS